MPLADLYGQTLRFEIDAGDRGTMQTLAVMWATIDDARLSPLVSKLAASLRADGARGVYDWIVRRVAFKRDPWNIELVRHPEQLIDALAEQDAGGATVAVDCDDVAVLGASLLAVMGYQPVLIVAGRRPDGPFEHVFFGFLEARPEPYTGPRPDRPAAPFYVVPMDPQERVPIGKFPPGVGRLAVFGHPHKFGFVPLPHSGNGRITLPYQAPNLHT